MFKNVSLVALAAVIAAVVTFMPAFAPDVAAETPAAASGQAGPFCALQGWPYYDAACLRGGSAGSVRVIGIDRVKAER